MRNAGGARNAMILATDFSKPARRAYSYALKLSSVLTFRLILLHGVKAHPDVEGWSPAARRSLGSLRTKAMLELGRMARVARDSGVITEHKLIVGIPEDSILDVAENTQAVLIAMGTHGRTGWDRLQLGSTAETILRKAPCPVFTVHAAAVADAPLSLRRLTFRRILVAMDFSAPSEAALRSAARLAKPFNARVVLLHALEPSSSSGSERSHVSESIDRTADRQFQTAVSAAQANRFVLDRISEPGKPVEVILNQAKRVMADVIVMGTNGRRGMHRLVLGSVAESVVRRAGCPVLVVKAATRKAGT
jgi:nucleotide-binding universal stress UspA family protein